METPTAYEGWAVVELMGHRKIAGYVSEAPQYGTAMLRVDCVTTEGEPVATQFYGGASIYALTPTTEEIVRRMAPLNPRPVRHYELTPPAPVGEAAEYTNVEELPFD